jgi:hypothetical protein
MNAALVLLLLFAKTLETFVMAVSNQWFSPQAEKAFERWAAALKDTGYTQRKTLVTVALYACALVYICLLPFTWAIRVVLAGEITFTGISGAETVATVLALTTVGVGVSLSGIPLTLSRLWINFGLAFLYWTCLAAVVQSQLMWIGISVYLIALFVHLNAIHRCSEHTDSVA